MKRRKFLGSLIGLVLAPKILLKAAENVQPKLLLYPWFQTPRKHVDYSEEYTQKFNKIFAKNPAYLDEFKCVITPNIKKCELRSTEWTVIIGEPSRALHIECFDSPLRKFFKRVLPW